MTEKMGLRESDLEKVTMKFDSTQLSEEGSTVYCNLLLFLI